MSPFLRSTNQPQQPQRGVGISIIRNLFLSFMFLGALGSCAQSTSAVTSEPVFCKQSPQIDYREWIQLAAPEVQEIANRTGFVVRVSESRFRIYVKMQEGRICTTVMVSQTQAFQDLVDNARAQTVPSTNRCKAGPFLKRDEKLDENEFFQVVAAFGLLRFSAGGPTIRETLDASEYYINSDEDCETVARVVRLSVLKNKNPLLVQK